MSIGLAITGLAALGVYMAAVTTDPAALLPVRQRLPDAFGYAMYVSPLKWLFILAPLAMVSAISAGIERLKPATSQMLFWVFSALMGIRYPRSSWCTPTPRSCGCSSSPRPRSAR